MHPPSKAASTAPASKPARWTAFPQVTLEARALLEIVQQSAQAEERAIVLPPLHVMQPMESLHDPHRWAIRPIELAGCRWAECDVESAKMDRPQPGIRVDNDPGWHGIG